jgi:hypothetical protein
MVNQAVKLEREKRRTLREERLWQLVTDPTVKRLLLLSAIIAYSTKVARSDKNEGPIQSALAFALPGIGIPLLAADAGIKDRWALAAISAAGVGYTTGQMLSGWQDAGLLTNPVDLFKMLTPWND